VASWLDDTSSTTADNIDYALNNAHQLRCSADKWPFMLWRKPLTFNLVADQTLYSLHAEFARPLYFYNLTQGLPMQEVPNRQVLDADISHTEDSDDRCFTLWGHTPVSAQPTAASVLTVTSTSGSDSAKTVVVRGETTYGVVEETLTVGVAGSTEFTEVLNVTLSATFVGQMTLSAASGGTLLNLPAGELGRQFRQFRTLYVPNVTDEIEYQFFRKPTPLTRDNAIPDIPAHFSKVLVYDALLHLAAYDKAMGAHTQFWQLQQQEWDQRLRQAHLDGQSLGSRAKYVKYIP
jgi:hypothetical protein